VRGRITDIQDHRLGKLNKNAALALSARTHAEAHIFASIDGVGHKGTHTSRIERVYFVPSVCVHVLHCLDAAEGDGKAEQ